MNLISIFDLLSCFNPALGARLSRVRGASSPASATKPCADHFDGGGSAAPDSTNRAPGDMEVSWKWRSDYRHSQNPFFQEQYKQVLSQVNFYMGQHKRAMALCLPTLS
ncbi:hypothetical protein N7499_011049 [Penicillium canescens]|nr:hypothetical protein N7499_011049 [Penicillium canescens]KAJ6182788.1 hypothetical protein N7485_001430 [Penicillium canescens]